MRLTRIRLTPDHDQTESLLNSLQDLHAAIAASFPTRRGSERILWRLDTPAGQPPTVYVTSPYGPDLEPAEKRLAAGGNIATRDYTPFLNTLTTGQAYRFRIAYNPTRAHTGADKRCRHTAILGYRNQTAWLTDQLTRAGAIVQPDTADTTATTLKFSGREHEITLVQATTDGVLTITDPDTFRRTLTTGIGRAKGYGCGLLTLAPLPRTA